MGVYGAVITAVLDDNGFPVAAVGPPESYFAITCSLYRSTCRGRVINPLVCTNEIEYRVLSSQAET